LQCASKKISYIGADVAGADRPTLIFPTGGSTIAAVTAASPGSITVDWSNMGSFQIGNLSRNWPLAYISSGVSIVPLQVALIGYDSGSASATLWNVNLSTGALTVALRLGYPLASMRVIDMSGNAPTAGLLFVHDSGFNISFSGTNKKSGVMQLLQGQLPL
jgi:hypothetical protein